MIVFCIPIALITFVQFTVVQLVKIPAAVAKAEITLIPWVPRQKM